MAPGDHLMRWNISGAFMHVLLGLAGQKMLSFRVGRR